MGTAKTYIFVTSRHIYLLSLAKLLVFGKMTLNAVLFVLNLSVSLGPLTNGTPSVEKEYSNVDGGETNDTRILGGWHPGDSTKYCMRRHYCTPWRIYRSPQCCYLPQCRRRPGVFRRCQLMSGYLFAFGK